MTIHYTNPLGEALTEHQSEEEQVRILTFSNYVRSGLVGEIGDLPRLQRELSETHGHFPGHDHATSWRITEAALRANRRAANEASKRNNKTQMRYLLAAAAALVVTLLTGAAALVMSPGLEDIQPGMSVLAYAPVIVGFVATIGLCLYSFKNHNSI